MGQDRPTISELEAILNSEDDRKVTINSDGTVTVGPSEVEELRAEIRRLRAALARYGDHEYECNLKNGAACSCGYEAALKDTTP